ncbi:TetR-like C-terminal domain-containing protein [Streptomyces cinereospinus]|uniref:TetR-like C-terminal domain-containing protein n=1 Tax=Streptomyces cinereospinus TaxID=285561 RepID=A0ABV5MX33_9ACTN
MRLLEDGVPLAELSVERLARTAGEATIYRRRRGKKEELLLDVVRAAEPPDPELPGACPRDDLVVLRAALRRRGLANRTAIPHNVHAQMKSGPHLWAACHSAVVAPRRRLGVEVLRRGQRDGELRADTGFELVHDVELVHDIVFGPLLVRSLPHPEAELPEGLAQQLVDTLPTGLRPVSSSAP